MQVLLYFWRGSQRPSAKTRGHHASCAISRNWAQRRGGTIGSASVCIGNKISHEKMMGVRGRLRESASLAVISAIWSVEGGGAQGTR